MNLVKIRIGLCVVLVCFLAVVSWADSELGSHKTDEIDEIYMAVNRAGFGPEWKLDKQGHVYVYITVGAGYVDVSAVAFYREYSKLGDDLYGSGRVSGESVVQSTHGAVKPGYAVTAFVKKSKFGVKVIDNHLKLGAFVAELKSRGWNPYVLLRIPDYASCEFTGVEKSKLPTLNRRRFVWYDATDIPNDAAIVVSAAVSPGLSAFFFYLRFILHCIGLLAMTIGLVIGLNKRLSIKSRKFAYDWGVSISLLAVLAGTVCYLTFLFSLFGRMISDMWYAVIEDGDPLLSLLGIIGALFIVSLIMLHFRSRVFRVREDELELENIDVLAASVRSSGL